MDGLEGLFTPREEDLALTTHVFGEEGDAVSVKVFASEAATTDYHLTGMIVWPISKLLAYYVFHERMRLRGARVLEIGAGCGLAGLLAASLGAEKCVISDGEELVVKIIEKNIRENKLERAQAALLRWGDPESLDHFQQDFANLGTFDLAFGADIFHASFGEPSEIFELLDNLGISIFWCGYVERKNRQAVFKAAKSFGWTWRSELPETFLPSNRSLDQLSERALELHVFTKGKK